MGNVFTKRQREVLHRRIARAICWKQAQVFQRDAANTLATGILDELEFSGFTAGTQRRAVEALVSSLGRDDAEPAA